MRAAARLALLASLAVVPSASADPLLRRHAPVYRHDSREVHPVASVHGRVARDGATTWLQYWSYHTYNSQDRGIFRTGRHEGDWELVQLRLHAGRPVAATYSQHSWGERCPWSGGTPAVFVANGSHAGLHRAGTSDRPWPDPDDEADGRGARLRPPVRLRSRALTRAGRWGGSRAGPVPGEQSSPVSPRFQPDRWDPARFEATARPCGAGPPGRPWATAAAAAALVLAIAGSAAAIRRGRRRRG